MSRIISIDLGTGNSSVAIIQNGKPVVIPNSEGNETTPSIVTITKNGSEHKVGEPAKRCAVVEANNTAYEVKRLIGRTYDEVVEEANRVSYKVINDNNVPKIEIEGKKYMPEQISSLVLAKLKKDAESYLGEPVDKCVITVPAAFNDEQRKKTKLAAELAGMECVRIINEPTAAALAYGLNSKTDRNILVFDQGSGTADATVINCSDDNVFEILSSFGNSRIGGSDIDNRIIDWLCDEFKQENNVDLKSDPMALQRIREAAEKAKIELSSTTQTEINLPYIYPVNGTPVHLVKTLTRSKLEQMISDLVDKMIDCAREALKAAKLKPENIDDWVMVGGTTRIPLVLQRIEEFAGKPVNHSVDPMTVVCQGAAIQAAILNQDESISSDVLLLDVTPLDLRIEVEHGMTATLIEANTTIPTTKEMEFSNAADQQNMATIHVVQGNRPKASDNKSLGMFNVDITPAPRGMARINVKFDINADGILEVTATDKATGKMKNIRIENNNGLSKEEIEQMKADAERFAEQDKKAEEEQKKLNSVEQFAYAVQQSVKDEHIFSKLTESQKSEIDSKINETLDAVSKKDSLLAENKRKELEALWSPIATQAYQTQTDAQMDEQTQTQQTASQSEDIRDADFEEVK